MENREVHSFGKLKEKVLTELSGALSTVTEEEVSDFCKILQPDKRVFCDAAGRSRLQIAGFAMRLAQMGYTAQLVGEPTSTAIRAEDVLVVCSASGNTPAIVDHAKMAKQLGCTVLLVTASPESSLSGLCDEKVLLKAASKKGNAELSIQPMGSLFEQSAGLLLDLLVIRIMDEYHITAAKMSINHSNME